MGLLDFFNRKSKEEINVEKSILNFKQGIYKYNTEDYLAAKNYFSTSINYNINLIQAYYYRGLTNVCVENYSDAISDFNIVIEKEPTNWNAYYYRGISNYEEINYEDAFEDLKLVIDNDSTNIESKEIFEKVKFIIETINNKKSKYTETNKTSVDEEFLEEIKYNEFGFDISRPVGGMANISPRSYPKEYLSNAKRYYEKNEFEKGIKDSKAALRAFRWVEKMELDKINGSLFFQANNIKILIEDLYTIELFSDKLKNRQNLTRVQKSEIVYSLSYGYYQVGDFGKAIDNINYSIDLIENIDFYLLRAKIYLSLKQFEFSLNDINKVLDLDKNNSEALDLLNQTKLNILHN